MRQPGAGTDPLSVHQAVRLGSPNGNARVAEAPALSERLVQDGGGGVTDKEVETFGGRREAQALVAEHTKPASERPGRPACPTNTGGARSAGFSAERDRPQALAGMHKPIQREEQAREGGGCERGQFGGAKGRPGAHADAFRRRGCGSGSADRLKSAEGSPCDDIRSGAFTKTRHGCESVVGEGSYRTSVTMSQQAER